MRPVDRALASLDRELAAMVDLVADLSSRIVRGEWDYKLFREYSERARRIKDSVRYLVLETIARYQPTASDLMKLINTYEVVYGLYRFTRYALDVSRFLSYFRDRLEIEENRCKLELSSRALEIVVRMVRMSIDAFRKRDSGLAENVIDMEKDIDAIFREAIEYAHKFQTSCACLDLSILIFLERIADHCAYIAQHLIQ